VTFPACLFSNARPKTGTEQIGTSDDTARNCAKEMLLDDVGVAVFDALELVGDVEAVTDLLGPRLDELEPATSAAASSAPVRSRRPGGIKARNSTPGAKHAAIADAS
jgi:hypothetical protein